jgi:hypothetical protein
MRCLVAVYGNLSGKQLMDSLTKKGIGQTFHGVGDELEEKRNSAHLLLGSLRPESVPDKPEPGLFSLLLGCFPTGVVTCCFGGKALLLLLLLLFLLLLCLTAVL